MASRAEDKLEELIAERERHRVAVRRFQEVGEDAIAKRHERLVTLVADEIRAHCAEHGLALPEDLD